LSRLIMGPLPPTVRVFSWANAPITRALRPRVAMNFFIGCFSWFFSDEPKIGPCTVRGGDINQSLTAPATHGRWCNQAQLWCHVGRGQGSAFGAGGPARG